ncbi:MAG: radical SAM protein [Nitrospiraceae bacterium]|nr:radical SAM protein [Nitrospiraceae bacterium]
MNILLVRPPDPLQHVTLLSHTKPMNLAYLAAYLRRCGFEVFIADFETSPYSDSSLLSILRERAPRVVGISCVTPTIRNGAAISALAKEYDRNIVTVIGGPHANGLPEETLEEFRAFDYLVYGEGEVTFAELCRHIMEGSACTSLQGLVLREDGSIRKNPPRQLIETLDSIPFPARDLIQAQNPTGHSTRGIPNRLRSTEIYTSRGCPYGCSFCAIQTTFGSRVRFRGIGYIEEEIRQVMRDFPFDHLVIADDTFTLARDRAFELCDVFRRNGIRSWNCDTRVNGVSRDLLKYMAESGCQKVAFGVESGSQRIIDRIGKKIRVDQVREAVRWAKEAGIRQIEGNFIIGSDPEETAEDVAMTEQLLKELPWTFVSVSVIVPYPGTPVYREMREKGLIADDADWEDFVMFGKYPKWRTTHFPSSDLINMQKRLTRKFYLNTSYIARRLMAVRSWGEMKYWFSAGAAYLKWYLYGRLR